MLVQTHVFVKYLCAFACGRPEHPRRRTWLHTDHTPAPQPELQREPDSLEGASIRQ